MGFVVIELAHDGCPQSVRTSVGMSRPDVRRAERIVTEHSAMLLERWSEIWD
jgi:hypothetical protein